MSSSTGASRYVLGRLSWGIAVIWIVLTATYLVIAALPESRMIGFAPVEMGFNAVMDTSADPVTRYLHWMGAFLTLEWGQSIFYNTSVLSLYEQRLPVTMAYVLPGLLLSVVVGTGLATYAAIEPNSRLDSAVSLLSYGGLGFPAFVVAEVLLVYFSTSLAWTGVPAPAMGFWDPRIVQRRVLAACIVALTFAAVQIRHVQGETGEYLSAEFVKTARSKGSGRLRIAVHVFRNTWPTFVSLILGEALGVLVLTTMVIEIAWGIPGIAVAIFNGFGAGDPMLSFTAVFGLVFLGVVGTLLRDFVRLAVDPRVER